MVPLKKIIEGVVNLPPTPRILPKLQRLLRDENTGIHEIISLLKVDAPMTAQIVRLSNSAFYNTGEPVQSLEEAVGRLGFREVYRVASVAAAHQLLSEAMPLYKLRKGELLETSVNCAVLMVEIRSRSRRGELDSAYTTGLLHSIGKVVINQYFMKHGLEVYGTGNETMESGFERVLLGFDYAEAGAAILEKWNFPADIVMPVQHQLMPWKAPDHVVAASQLAVARTAANMIRAVEDEAIVAAVDQEVLACAGLDLDALRDALADARTGLDEVESLLR
jgi:HD-like signal output (HDOD) protein